MAIRWKRAKQCRNLLSLKLKISHFVAFDFASDTNTTGQEKVILHQTTSGFAYKLESLSNL